MKHEFYLAGDTIAVVGGTKKWSRAELETLKIQIAAHNDVSPDMITCHSFPTKSNNTNVKIDDKVIKTLLEGIPGISIKRDSKM